MLKILKEEYVNKYGQKNFLLLRSIKCYYFDLNFRVVVLIRKMLKSKLKYIKELIYKKLKLKYTMDINIDVKIGKGFCTEHFIGMVIGKKVVIGNNCKIYQNVTIGQKNGDYPIIGNNVTIYPGAIILGNIKIEDNAIIQANSVVLENVPENAIVAGNPAVVKKRRM